MKRTLLTTLLMVAALAVGIFVGRTMGGSAVPASSTPDDSPSVLYWVAPMDPNYRRDAPGKSPMGMDLVPVYAGASDDAEGMVTIDPTMINNLGVRTAIAKRSSLVRSIDTVGFVAFDEETVEHVHTRVDGWVETLTVAASGDAVEKGQLLFAIDSPTLVNAQEEYLVAVRSGNTGLINASKQRLGSLGVGDKEIERLARERTVNPLVRVYAESDGVVSHLGARQGLFVTPATELMAIAKLDTIWVVAEVLERQAAWVQPGQQATVELDAFPGRQWSGSVDYVYPELDARTRALRVRLRFENLTESLKPNMFARVNIATDPLGNLIQVPREAVIRTGSSSRVVLALGNGRFRSQEVLLGLEAGGLIAVRRGLKEGDRVVTSAQFLLDSESNAARALDRLEQTQ